MVTSNGGHSLHHHLRHFSRLSNSLFNRRSTKQTFTQWPQASTLVHPEWPSRPLISTPADRVQSYMTLYVLGLSRSITRITPPPPKKKPFSKINIYDFLLGVYLLKLFWNKFTRSFYKLDHFITASIISPALKEFNVQKV